MGMDADRTERDVLQLVIRPYTIDLLHALEKEPVRFRDLNKLVQNEMTLSNKIRKLLDYGLIEIVPIKTGRRYVNCYTISTKGRKLLLILKKIDKL